MDSCDLKKTEIMWKYELEYRIDKPETEGETDKQFDLDNYKDWLEEQLTNCRKQLSIASVSKSLAPHRCPVCNGNGLVPNGFYMQTNGNWSTSSITPETCHSCNGTGIVWG